MVIVLVVLQFMVSDSTFGSCIFKVEVITSNTFYSHHYDFVNNYCMSVSQVTTYTVLTLFMSYHRLCNKSNTTGATSGAGTTNPSEVHVFCGVRVFCFSFYPFYFDHSIGYCQSSSIYVIPLPFDIFQLFLPSILLYLNYIKIQILIIQ